MEGSKFITQLINNAKEHEEEQFRGGGLHNYDPYVAYVKDSGQICLDGFFTKEELKEIVDYMYSHSN